MEPTRQGQPEQNDVPGVNPMHMTEDGAAGAGPPHAEPSGEPSGEPSAEPSGVAPEPTVVSSVEDETAVPASACVGLARAICGRKIACGGLDADDAVAVDLCERANAASCDWESSQRVDFSAAACLAEVDVGSCHRFLGAFGVNAYTTSLVGCGLRGALPDAELCVEDQQCASAVCQPVLFSCSACSDSSAPLLEDVGDAPLEPDCRNPQLIELDGTCQPLLDTPGAQCVNGQCDPLAGLVCRRSSVVRDAQGIVIEATLSCQPYLTQGAGCESRFDCAPGLTCEGVVFSDLGQVQPGTCEPIAYADQGEACTLDGCIAPYWCVNSKCSLPTPRDAESSCDRIGLQLLEPEGPQLGTACSPNTVDRSQPMLAVDTGCSYGVCLAHFAADDSCEAGEYCVTEDSYCTCLCDSGSTLMPTCECPGGYACQDAPLTTGEVVGLCSRQ